MKHMCYVADKISRANMKTPVQMKELVLPLTCMLILWIFFATGLLSKQNNKIKLHHNKIKFIVDSPSCKIPIIDPWDKTILSAVAKDKIPYCIKTSQLTYIDGNHLKVNLTLLDEKYKLATCEYQIIQRPSNNDKSIKLSKPLMIPMQNGTEIKDEYIKVSCFKSEKNKILIYTNYHVLVVDKGKDKENQTKGEAWNILLIGTDSMSRSAGVRYLPKTRKYLLDTLGATELIGYTKVGLNTFPNMVPFLTGFHVEEIAQPSSGPYDQYPLIFKNFSAAGYKTLYAEDEPTLATFNCGGKGFRNPPTDHYFRPVSLAIANHKSVQYKGCERYLEEPRLILDYLANFVSKYQHKKPFIGLTFLSGLSHDGQSLSRRLDQPYEELLKHFDHLDIWNNTVLLFFGDHGDRFGGIVKTEVGRIENNMPMMYVVLPKRFKQKYPQFSDDLKTNRKRLTTPFESYETLRHFLSLRENVTWAPLRHGISLLSEVPRNRTCFSSNIPLQFCICYQEEKVDLKDALVHEGALFLVTKMNTILKESSKVCSDLQLHNISSAAVFKSDNESKVYRIIYTTKPGYGKFQGTLHFNQRDVSNSTGADGAYIKPMFSTEGPISRLNKYGNQSICTKIPLHRLYCFCKDQVS